MLPVGDLHGKMRGNRVRELGRIVDLGDRRQRLGGHFLVQLDVLLEVRLRGADQRLGFLRFAFGIGNLLDGGLEEIGTGAEAGHARAALAFDQHANGLVGQLQKLKHGRQRADAVKAIGRRIIVGRVLLRQQQDLLLFAHHFFESAHGFFAPHKERNDHMGENDNIAER